MITPSIQNKAVDAITLMNTSVINLRLYPPTSAMINLTIDRLLQVLSEMLAEESPLIFAESERMLLFGDDPAWTRNQEKAHVRAFVDILINHGIKNISFSRGLEKEELLAFFQVLSRQPDEVRAGGGIQEMLASQEVLHIRIEEKIYLGKNVNRLITDSLEANDGIINMLMGSIDPESFRFLQLKEQAKNRDWITGVFDLWLKQFKEKQGAVPNAQLAQDLVRVAEMLLKVAEPEGISHICLLFSTAIAEMETDMISQILSRDVRNVCGEELFAEVIGRLDADRFQEVYDGVSGIASPAGRQNGAAAASLDSLKNTDKGRALEDKRRTEAAKAREEREGRLNRLREQARQILKEEPAAMLDHLLMAELPGITRELHLLGDGETAKAIVERLSTNLHSRNPDHRNRTVEIVSRMLSQTIEAGPQGLMELLGEKLAGWLRSEAAYSDLFDRTYRQLKELARSLLERDPFREVNPILDVLSLTQTGRSPKDRRMTDLASVALRELATENLLAVLMQEFQTNEQGRQKDAARNLARLGEAPVQTLLSMLEHSADSDERIRIIHVISEIGAPSIPAIVQRISQNGPWYIMRNLAYALSRVGGEEQAKEYIPLLLHENEKVQVEALKGLQRTGGKVRSETLLAVLPKADNAFKAKIVEMLGIIKSSGAVPALLELLESKKTVMPAAMKADLDAKICTALGNIGSEEALPALKEIAKSKGFFTINVAYPEQVRNAAQKAVALITRNKP